MTEDQFKEALLSLQNSIIGSKRVPGLIANSACLILNSSDGRISVKGKKVAYGYQLVACLKFGRETIGKLEASKTQESLIISHLCGTRNCINPRHLVLESKATNDERTHCHFCLANSKDRSQFYECGACPHEPKCGTKTIAFL